MTSFVRYISFVSFVSFVSLYFVRCVTAMYHCRIFHALSSIDGCIVCGNRYVISDITLIFANC